MKISNILRIIATPLSWLYAAGVWVRNVLYDDHILPSYQVPVPTIAIGNLAVGGTGKTPMAEYLIRLLAEQYKIAVLSRGYGRITSGFRMAGSNDTAQTIGDEPMLIHTKFPHIPVAVCADRVYGVKALLKQIPDLQCVILDDAYQHRRLKAGFYILLTTYGNLYVNDHFLPRGYLRDLPVESIRANAVVVTKCPKSMLPIERRVVSNTLRLTSYQQLYYSSIAYEPIPLHSTPLLVTGIANPQPMLEYLQEQYPNTELLQYPDHHKFTDKDVQTIIAKSTGYEHIVTTQKDYMRMQQTSLVEQLGSKLVVLPIATDMGIDKAAFDRQVLLYVAENNRKLKNIKS